MAEGNTDHKQSQGQIWPIVPVTSISLHL